ncbi:MAG: hypothetical protein M3Z31_07860 [Pseudomonadota bacterium]|nr:hypothetical protein [Pseudomonadota bacterium]
MEWILLESLVALLVLLFIVWWTMRPLRTPKAPQDDPRVGREDASP